METYKILDRFELMFPQIEELADLRRAYIDKDFYSIFKLANADEELRKAVLEKNIHSIFRLVDSAQIQGSADDLKKAVLDKNLYSIFRLLPEQFDDLKKAVCEDNVHSIYRLLDAEQLKKIIEYNNPWAVYDKLIELTDSQFAHSMKFMLNENIDFEEDCLSRGQIQSKKWLVNTLEEVIGDSNLQTVYLCAGWYGTLATMLFESKLQMDKIRSFDIDPSCADIAETFNKKWLVEDWKFKATTKDINDINFFEHDYKTIKGDGTLEKQWDIPNTIINTSCEHIPEFEKWYEKIPNDRLIVFQCNNFFDIPEHVNCHNDLDSFAQQTPLKVEFFSGELDLGKYKRFMRIGIK
jgi:hypothetical protein